MDIILAMTSIHEFSRERFEDARARIAPSIHRTPLVPSRTLSDRIGAPVYHEFSEEEILDWLADNGFSDVERLTRYPRYDNVRRFLSPLYNDHSHQLSRMLYGSGQMGIKAVKDTR